MALSAQMTEKQKVKQQIAGKKIRLKVLRKNADVYLNANLRDEYNDAVKQISQVEEELSTLQRGLNKATAEVPKYDKKLGLQEKKDIEEQYAFLQESLAAVGDANSPEAKTIKKKIDDLVEPYRQAISNAAGVEFSKTVALGQLNKTLGSNAPMVETAGAPAVSAPPAMAGAKPTKAAQTPAPTPAEPPAKKTPVSKTPAATSKAPTSGPLPASFTPTPIVDTSGAKREELLSAANADFSLPEVLFKNVPSLKTILDQAIAQNWTPDKLRNAIRNDMWYRQNSAEIKKRFVQKYNYDDLVAKGQATGSSDYEMQIAKIESSLKKKAAQMGSAAASDPTALRKAAENLYITNRSEDDSYITDFLAAAIKPVAGMIGGKVTQGYSGQALQDYQQLQGIAKANGFSVADIIPGGANEAQVLGMIQSGTLDINRIAQDARKMAAQGQPEYVRQLLGQGYNLDQVYAPYRRTMANVLEIQDPEQIDLNDPVLRGAITDKGDMNLYDFKKALRADKRWQYTQNARDEVSAATMQVLRDFGFQG